MVCRFSHKYGVSGYGLFPDPTTCFTQEQLPIMIGEGIGDNFHTSVVEVDNNENLIFGGVKQNSPTSTTPFIGFYHNEVDKSRLKWLNFYSIPNPVTTHNVYLEGVIDIEINNDFMIAVIKTRPFTFNAISSFSQIFISFEKVNGNITHAITFNEVCYRDRYQQLQIDSSGNSYLIRTIYEDYGNGTGTVQNQIVMMNQDLRAVQWVKQLTYTGAGFAYFLFQSILLYNNGNSLLVAGLHGDEASQNLMLYKIDSVYANQFVNIYQSGSYMYQGGLQPEYMDITPGQNYLVGCLSMGAIREYTASGFFVFQLTTNILKDLYQTQNTTTSELYKCSGAAYANNNLFVFFVNMDTSSKFNRFIKWSFTSFGTSVTLIPLFIFPKKYSSSNILIRQVVPTRLGSETFLFAGSAYLTEGIASIGYLSSNVGTYNCFNPFDYPFITGYLVVSELPKTVYFTYPYTDSITYNAGLIPTDVTILKSNVDYLAQQKPKYFQSEVEYCNVQEEEKVYQIGVTAKFYVDTTLMNTHSSISFKIIRKYCDWFPRFESKVIIQDQLYFIGDKPTKLKIAAPKYSNSYCVQNLQYSLTSQKPSVNIHQDFLDFDQNSLEFSIFTSDQKLEDSQIEVTLTVKIVTLRSFNNKEHYQTKKFKVVLMNQELKNKPPAFKNNLENQKAMCSFSSEYQLPEIEDPENDLYQIEYMTDPISAASFTQFDGQKFRFIPKIIQEQKYQKQQILAL
eukprot:403357399